MIAASFNVLTETDAGLALKFFNIDLTNTIDELLTIDDLPEVALGKILARLTEYSQLLEGPLVIAKEPKLEDAVDNAHNKRSRQNDSIAFQPDYFFGRNPEHEKPFANDGVEKVSRKTKGP